MPVTSAFALTRVVHSKPKVAKTSGPRTIVTKLTVDGPSVRSHHWGYMEVQLKVIQTETIVGSKDSVSIKITGVSWPVFPNHTPRSIYINTQALPLLQAETLQLQANAWIDLVNISGASNTTVAWRSSLQVALAKAETPAVSTAT